MIWSLINGCGENNNAYAHHSKMLMKEYPMNEMLEWHV